MILCLPATWLTMPVYSLAPLFQLRGLVFVLLAVSCLWAFLRRARVSVTRTLPRLATAGEIMHYRVHVSNVGNKPIAGACLLEMPADNRPSFLLFSRSKEPGEESRNIFDRTLGYYRWQWLQRSLTFFTTSPSPTLPRLKPRESTTLTLSLTPKKRGVIILRDPRLCLPDPLGIFQRCRPTDSARDKVIVLPHRYRLPLLELPGSARFQLGGESTSNSIGQSGDFTSVRDYRPGDPIRHIHWKSWAKTGQPIVKEHQDVFFPRYGLILDTFVRPEHANLFEEAVSVAASFAASIDTRDALLDLMFIRDQAFVFSAGRGEERIDTMLEILAGVSCDPNTDFEALQQLLLKYRDELTACICVFTGWCEQRRDTISRLHRAGMNLKIIALCDSLDEAHQLQQRYPSPCPVQWLRAGHIQKDLMATHS